MRLQKRKPIIFPPSGQSAEEAEWQAHRHYAVIVDAGSSGSRLMVYSWRDVERERSVRVEKNMPLDVLPVVEKGTWEGSQRPWQVKLEPGLSSFAGRVDDVRVYLEELFSHVQSVVPPDAWARTPIHVLATAGMRMLEPTARKAILQETCRVLHTLPFAVRNSTATEDADSACGGQVRVISGEEEGLFGWIAINYLMDGFRSLPADGVRDEATETMNGTTTYGFLDMGGASTQIAFEPSAEALAVSDATGTEASTPLQKDLFDVHFRRLDASTVKHQVFVTTFLGFGTNAARTRYLASLAEAHGLAAPMQDPCLPKNLRISHEEVGDVVGTGSFSQCLALQQPLLDREAECARPPCLFHGVHVPAIDFTSNQFIGVSEYWYSSHDVFDLGGAYDYTTYQQAAQKFCAEEWTTLEAKLSQKHYKEQVTLSRLQMQCFKAAWVITVLHEGLRLPRLGEGDARWNATDETHDLPDKASDKNLFQSINDVRGVSVSWALGKAILEASAHIPDAPCTTCTADAAALPIGAPGSAAPTLGSAWSAAAVWPPCFVLLAVVCGLVWRWRTRADRTAWTPLPTNDTSRDKPLDGAAAEDAWVDTGDALERVPLRTRRSLRRKQARKARRSALSAMVHDTAAYAQHQFKRFVRGGPPVPPSKRDAEPALSVRVVPCRLHDQQPEQLTRDGYPRVPAPWASALVREHSSSPHTPVFSPSQPSTPLGSGRVSRAVSPIGDARCDTPSAPRTPYATSSAAVASGSRFASRPPSRGPSPMMLESRRPSLVTTASLPTHLFPVDTRMRSPIDPHLAPRAPSPAPDAP